MLRDLCADIVKVVNMAGRVKSSKRAAELQFDFKIETMGMSLLCSIHMVAMVKICI